jgi:sugar/nucleoside kinase (ribokinase family)
MSLTSPRKISFILKENTKPTFEEGKVSLLGIMKKYDIFGIGHALVDMEFTVTTQWLEKMNVEKGVMTLVDENRQHELMNNLDPFEAKKFCGGSAANTAIAISQYGGRCFYTCKVASDELGTFYFEDLIREGVASNLHHLREKGITGKCMVFITPDAERSMNTFLGISGELSEKDIQEKEIMDSEYIYLEGYLASSSSGKIAAMAARKIAQENGVKVSITFSDLSMVRHFRPQLMEMIGEKVDLLFCNLDEAMEFTGYKKMEDVLKRIQGIAEKFAITMGPKGAILFDGQHFHHVSAPKVTPLDTTGAGDLFAGSFLYAITHGKNFPEAGNLATKAASLLVTQYGARLRVEQIKELSGN